MKLKIGRNEYEITKDDQFMDNGACVQLLTQSKEESSWGSKPNPVLSKKAVKEISAHGRIDHPYKASIGGAEIEGVQVFSLDL